MLDAASLRLEADRLNTNARKARGSSGLSKVPEKPMPTWLATSPLAAPLLRWLHAAAAGHGLALSPGGLAGCLGDGGTALCGIARGYGAYEEPSGVKGCGVLELGKMIDALGKLPVLHLLVVQDSFAGLT